MKPVAIILAAVFPFAMGSIASAQMLDLAQQDAVKAAKSYLSREGFSRGGLIDQLTSPYGYGYSAEVATAAVNSLPVDWNAQAAKVARSYVRMMDFSCEGLIAQLSSRSGEQYTQSEAAYGARQAGAC